MAIANYSKFATYKHHIDSLSSPDSDEMLTSETFLLDQDQAKNLEIYYAPFEHVNEDAKVVIVGITPGLHQMKKSFSTVWNLKDQYIEDNEVLSEVKKNSSFEGPMRKNLITMLDELGLAEQLGLSSSSELFSSASDLVHTTSVLTYPVFYKGKNYSGSTPNLLKNELLQRYLIANFPQEIEKMDNPLIIPLGVNVTKALQFLQEENYMKAGTIQEGFPHPSGGNGHRHRQFAENKDKMKKIIEDYFL
ncbi:uracil-DNA glycosylase family protein [Thalassobacillus sp. B23F22_16]|uniref:uracil-DNA glycosylase family protein n=1 Tax=Thalassobacillus sp. B23F22_16 TaxID=3459513 RepID=UPI00373E273B